MQIMPDCSLNLEQLLQQQIRNLALTRQPSTMHGYQATANRFVTYLSTSAPQLQHVAELRRDPHLLGWFRSLAEQQPPLSPKSRWSHLLLLRRLLEELAGAGHPVADQLIRREDFPPLPVYLPRALSVDDDHRLQEQLRLTEGWEASALLLLRLTGMRIGECMDLPADCLRQIGPDSWGVHVPLGKLHTERLVPADQEIRAAVARIEAVRSEKADARAPEFLLPRTGARCTLYNQLRAALDQAAQRAGCSAAVTPHPLRHTFATEMVRWGVSLPALMQLLGHRDIRMTLRYVQITQVDLQREYFAARRKAAERYTVPQLAAPTEPTAPALAPGLAGIRQALAAIRHLLEMYRRQLTDEKASRKVRRLDGRLQAVAVEVQKLDTVQIDQILAG
jgi:site-specific recombinase XerD